MPYWFEINKKRVGKERDKRRKLTEEEIRFIKELYQEGVPIRRITKIIGKVDRRAIYWHLFPEIRERMYEYKRARNWDYKKEAHTKRMRKYRQHLKEIYGTKRK